MDIYLCRTYQKSLVSKNIFKIYLQKNQEFSMASLKLFFFKNIFHGLIRKNYIFREKGFPWGNIPNFVKNIFPEYCEKKILKCI